MRRGRRASSVCREEAKYSQNRSFSGARSMADRRREGGDHHRRRRSRRAAPEDDDDDEPRVPVPDHRSVSAAEYTRSVLQPNTNQDPAKMSGMDEDQVNRKDLKRSKRVSKKELRTYGIPAYLAHEGHELQAIYKGICTIINTIAVFRRRYLKLALKMSPTELTQCKDAVGLLARIKGCHLEIKSHHDKVKALGGTFYEIPAILSSELKMKDTA